MPPCRNSKFIGYTMLLLIDNYDSFTYNLYQYFCELGTQVLVKRNDELQLDDIEHLAPSHLVISPGPCSPNEAGISLAVIRHFANTLPILGVCLGHQALGQAFGAKVIRARQAMHGKTSTIRHNNSGVFYGLNQPLVVTRYHSLVIDKCSLPDCFELTAWTEQNGIIDEIMGIQHQSLPLHGVQFHPESILSEQGHALLNNFLKI
ncbi:Anthranilate/para-aminobenzoate synthases component II [Candidatus Regiella insecticola LSR1]|uniref:Aminodeoxychorismate synthase component 2 n=2 Tax=Candidatus Regiella insecticola TaxID=138073 RepID=E0WT44_9ENTR|nr:Anthranilate/para-aminobenzoate synthases component II [Candidatus Regiella insecticola LSR1]